MANQTPQAEIDKIAEAVEPPMGVSANALDLTVVCETVPGETLGGYFSGKGGSRRWGVAWFNGLAPVKPYIHLFDEGVPEMDCHRLIAAIREGVLARIRERFERLVREQQERETEVSQSTEDAERDAAAARRAKILAAANARRA